MNAMPRRPVPGLRVQAGIIPVWRRVAAWLALWVVLSGALGGLAPVQARESALGSVVCTAAGMMVIADQQDGGPGSTEATQTAPCLLCLPLLHGGVLAPQMSQAAFPSSPVKAAAMRSDAAWHPVVDPHRHPSAPRAPPLFAQS